MALPPGPKNKLTQTVRQAYQPFQCFPEWQQKYGDPFTLASLLGTMVVTGDPENVQAILSADPSTFDFFGTDAVVPLAGETSVSVSNGHHHTKRRKLLMPAFLGNQMRASGQAIVDIAEKYASRWPQGKPFTLYDTTISISMETMVRVVMALEDPQAIERCRDAVTRYVQMFKTSITFIYALRKDFFGVGPWATFQRAKKALNEIIYTEIANRRRSGNHGGGILGLMLGARYEDGSLPDDSEIRDQLVTLMFAGHETTGAALAWAFYWIHRDEAVLQKLLEELDGAGPAPSPDAISELPYLNAVCNEALRIHPTVADVYRLVRKPFSLKGYECPVGSGIDISVILLHHHPDLYPQSHLFRPERFLERKFSVAEYLPFGGGARRCLGASFALYEMKLVLATVLKRYRMRLVEKQPVVPMRHGVVIAPRGGVRVVVDGLRN